MVRRTKKPEIPTGPFARITYWQGLEPHDEIRVKGKPGQRCRYEFLAFVQNTQTGECFVEVLGGRLDRDGTYQRNMRMFSPERCTPPPRRRRPRRALDPSVSQMSFEGLALDASE